ELLLADAGTGEAAIVVGGIHDAGIRQREDLVAHRREQHARIALLEVGAPAAADQQRVAGEHHRMVVEHVARAAVGVARCGAGLQASLPQGNGIKTLHKNISPLRATRAWYGDPATELLAQQPSAGDVIGVHVSLERPLELEAELLDERDVAP